LLKLVELDYFPECWFFIKTEEGTIKWSELKMEEEIGQGGQGTVHSPI
jgi:hypothetical protein